MDHLTASGLAAEAARILATTPVPLPALRVPVGHAGEAEAGWWHIFGLMHRDRLEAEVAAANREFARLTDDATQRRLIARSRARPCDKVDQRRDPTGSEPSRMSRYSGRPPRRPRLDSESRERWRPSPPQPPRPPPPKHDVETTLLDVAAAAVKRLIARGKERGYITFDELNAVLPPEQNSSEQIEDVMANLNEMGIQVVESEETEDGEAPPSSQGR